MSKSKPIHHNTAVSPEKPVGYPILVDGNIRNQMFIPAAKPTYKETTNEVRRTPKTK